MTTINVSPDELHRIGSGNQRFLVEEQTFPCFKRVEKPIPREGEFIRLKAVTDHPASVFFGVLVVRITHRLLYSWIERGEPMNRRRVMIFSVVPVHRPPPTFLSGALLRAPYRAGFAVGVGFALFLGFVALTVSQWLGA